MEGILSKQKGREICASTFRKEDDYRILGSLCLYLLKELLFEKIAAMSTLINCTATYIIPNIDSTNIPNVISEHCIINYFRGMGF
jgi:hypothetical protein